MSPTSSSPDPDGGEARSAELRRAELNSGLARLRARIADAARSVGRDPAEITLIAVTKTYPASDVVALADLGVHDIGENRDQEAKAKAVDVSALLAARAAAPVHWHFVGQLQSRKSRSVAGYASAVHSLDRMDLVHRLDAAVAAVAAETGRRALDVFIQVSLDGDPARGGAAADSVPALAAAVATAAQLRLCGVMAVAPLGEDPEPAFARLAEISLRLRRDHPDATMISAGMSDDLESAVRNGSTHLRVGSALLGRRAPVFG